MALWQLWINWAININRWTIVVYVHVVKNAPSYHRERGLLKNSSRSSAAAWKFHGNPNAKTARFSEIQRITVALVFVLRDMLSELFPYKSEAL